METQNSLVLFDGVCNLCNGAVQFILKQEKDSQLQFASLQSKVGSELCLKYNIDTRETDSIIFISGNGALVKSKAVFEICKHLKNPWKAISVFSFFPTFLNDFFYDIIAKYRYSLFGKRDECWLPTKNLQSRFIS